MTNDIPLSCILLESHITEQHSGLYRQWQQWYHVAMPNLQCSVTVIQDSGKSQYAQERDLVLYIPYNWVFFFIIIKEQFYIRKYTPWGFLLRERFYKNKKKEKRKEKTCSFLYWQQCHKSRRHQLAWIIIFTRKWKNKVLCKGHGKVIRLILAWNGHAI